MILLEHGLYKTRLVQYINQIEINHFNREVESIWCDQIYTLLSQYVGVTKLL